jgi:type IV pilus assembly protein PilZ
MYQLQQRYESKDALSRAYLPFINDGALFVPSEEPWSLGDTLQLVIDLALPDEPREYYEIQGVIAWINPSGAVGDFDRAGVGVQFVGGEATALRQAIEDCLATQKITI